MAIMKGEQMTEIWVYEVHPWTPGTSSQPKPRYFHDEDQAKQFIANNHVTRAYRLRLEATSQREGRPVISDNPYNPQWSSTANTFYKEAERIVLDVTKTVVLAEAAG